MSILRRAVPALLAGWVFLWLIPPSNADLIFLKDGYVLQGRVIERKTLEFDATTKTIVDFPQGHIFVDDVVRRVFFSYDLLREVKERKPPKDEVFVSPNPARSLNPRVIPAIEEIIEAPSFNGKWERFWKVRTVQGPLSLPQRAAAIGPYFARFDTFGMYAGSAFYLTRELPIEVVQGLLSTHPEQTRKDLKPEELLLRRQKLVDFYTQAGWFGEAEAILQRIQTDFPDQKNQTEMELARLSRIRTRERIEEIKRLHIAGAYNKMLEAIEKIPPGDADEDALAKLQDLRNDAESRLDRVKQAKRYLREIPDKINDGNRRAFLEIAAILEKEIHADGVNRLEPFLDLGRGFVRQIEAGKTPTTSASEILSLAVTGWLQGKAAAETKPEQALRAWQARQMILNYLKPVDPLQRANVLSQYRRDASKPFEVDELVQLLPYLPPVEPGESATPVPVERTFQNTSGQAIRYWLQVPPEYHAGRSYPVVIVLHQGGEKPEDMIRRWSDAAAENGFIVIAPAWESGGGISRAYTYSEREHGTVLESLWDLQRRYSIDSDRVFLFGHGQGGNMAYDVGLAHPDLFAGVIPMGGAPEYFTFTYWRNGQNLPFYVITGDASGEPHKNTKKLIDNWFLRNYPMIWVQYKGRGPEFFAGEVPLIFDWMRHKRRTFPIQQLGSDGGGGPLGNEFMSMRQSDNRFYWLSSSAISPTCCNSATSWNGNVKPARFQGRIDLTNNDIYLKVFGLKQLTISFGRRVGDEIRNMRSENMIDFTRPVNVRVGFSIPSRLKVTPSLETMLEDLYLRGDRQFVFLGKIDLKL